MEVERANDEGRECKRASVQMTKGDKTGGREYESISGKRWKVEETEKILKQVSVKKNNRIRKDKDTETVPNQSYEQQ